MSYGYKVSVVRVTPPRKPDDFIQFDDPALGQGGMRDVLRSKLNQLLAATGEADDRRSTYLRFDDVSTNGAVASVLLASGGAYGEPGEIVNTTNHRHAGAVSATDAVLHDARLIFYMPENGTHGVLVSEARGRSHLGPPVINRLNRALRADGLYLRIENEAADGVAWAGFLDAEDSVGVSAVEFVQHQRSNDETRLTENNVIRGATIRLRLERTGPIRRRIVRAINRNRGRDNPRIELASLVGLRGYSDGDFDEERVVVVQDGKERTLNVTRGWPSFIYQLPDERLGDNDLFAAHVREAVEDTFGYLDVDLPPGWSVV